MLTARARRPAWRWPTARIAADVGGLSALDPRRTFLELVDPRELPDDLVEDIRRLKFQGVAPR